MKTKMIIALAALTLTACTNNLHALIKTCAFAQAATTAANYARQHKLKTAGMVIGGAIALDQLQVGVRYLHHISPWHQAKIKKASDDFAAAYARSSELKKAYNDIPWEEFGTNAKKFQANDAYIDQIKKEVDPAGEALKKFPQFFSKYSKSFLYRAYAKLTGRPLP